MASIPASTTPPRARSRRGRRRGICLALAACALAGCAGTRSPVRAFYENDYAYAIKVFRERAALKDKNFALYSCDLGEALLAAGDLKAAREAFLDATMVMHNLGEGEMRGLGSLIGPESIKVFKGDPFEKAMVDAATGVVNYALGDYENAAVGFRRALLADKDSEEGYQDDFGLAHYMLGKSLLRLGDVEQARVGFRNARKCAPDNPYVSFERNKQVNLTLVIDLGRAPVKEPSGVAGSIDVYRRARYPEAYAVISIDGKQAGRSAQILDLFEQARHSGRSLKDAIQTAKGAAKLGAAGVAAFSGDDRVRLIALLIAILLPAQADIRQCELLPGEVHVFNAALPPGEHTITLQFYTADGRRLPHYAQTLSRVRVETGRETFLYCRAIPFRGMPKKPPAKQENSNEKK